jgi:hypothetical protein
LHDDTNSTGRHGLSVPSLDELLAVEAQVAKLAAEVAELRGKVGSEWMTRRQISAHTGISVSTLEKTTIPGQCRVPGSTSVRYHVPTVDQWLLGQGAGPYAGERVR